MQPIIPSFRLLVLAAAFLITFPLAAQDFLAVADTICLELGSNDSGNVLDNDFLPGPSDEFTIQAGGNECVRISPSGVVSLNPNAGTTCCGEEFLFEYRILECEGQGCATTVLVQVKCPKPDCDLVDLDNLPSGNIDPSGEGQGHACLPACENSTATYYLAYQDGYSYDWSATNGSVSYTPAPPAEVSVTWGSLGPASLFLYRTDPDGLIDTVEYCVTLTPSPVADFDVTAITCLDQATQFFDNSTGAVSWYWDFGDGTSSTLPNPTHSYSSSGTYTVTLTVTSGGGTNPDGSPACCCSHTTTQQVTVDPLPGPNIYWISTLCAGDESVYWTDALGCGDYAWTVLDANGDPVPFSFVGSGMDSILVDWGDGPSGTISLAVSGCPQQYCPQPTTVLVPIISTIGTIAGPLEVCRGATATYSLPKWPGVSYQWAVTGGTLVGDATGHTATVTWDEVGTGTLNVTYGSDFLAGLPNHEAGDCFGTAELDVDVLGSFAITDGLGGTGCLTGNSFIFATSDFPGATFTWTVADAGGAPVTSFTGQGSNAINIDWSGGSGTGTYTVTAVPLSPGPGDYCVDEQQLTIEVITVDPPSFTGPDPYCPGEQYNYAITAPDPSLLYQWTVTGGIIISGQNGPNPVIEWTSPTGGSLSVVAIQLSPIYCVSEPSTALMVTPLAAAGPLALDVTTACINSQQTYTLLPAQPAGATYSWSIVPATAGTIISGADAPLVTIQWNNSNGSVTLNAMVTVCDQTLMLAQPLQLDVPTPATIVQSNDLCPGVTADLTANGGPYTNYSWSTGASGPAASTITISAGGAYSVTTTDADGCTAVASYVANELPGIDPFLSTGDPTVYCVGADGSPTGQSVNLVIPTTGSYDFDWYCNNALQTGTTGATFVHPVTNSVGTFEYYAIVTDNTTGCQDTSNVITVRQIACGPGENCAGPSPNFTPIAANQTPDCSVVDLDVSMPPFVTATNWVLPAGSTVLSGSTSANSLDVRFPRAGCYSVTCEATVPNNSPPPANCVYREIISVCVPVQADFTYTDDCGTVTFDNGTTFLDGTVITGYSWDFGDPGTLTDVSTAADPSYTYPAPGTYTVSLTVTTADGCQASFSQAVTVGPALTPVITVAPGPYCVGDPISFSASATGAIQFTWDFGDGATFVGAMPQHAYSAPGNYTINLEVEDAFGCSQTTSTVVNVQPGPDPVTIAVAPDALLCPGETATLSVPAAAGISYSWSNGATGNSTTVSTAGTYDVTLTTASGCTFVAEPVDISVLPAPPATITGNDIICDQGSTTLNGPAGPYSYAWTDGSGDPVGFGGAFLTVSTGPTFNPPYTLTVTDANGCSSVSAPFDITQTASPTVSISSMGSGCAGEPNVLTATSPTAGVSYTWSTGATGPTITVAQAGAYTVVVTDPQTGCTGSATFDIYPLPDLCVVPTGCYATCAPDTICGPVGEGYQYQWSYNGLPLAAGTDRCLEVSQPGSYSLAVTDANGCTAYSDSLYLEIEDCGDCSDLVTKLNPVDSDAGTCCFELYYDGLPDGVFAIQISTADGDLSLVPGSVDPDLQEYLTPGGAIQVAPFTDPALPPTADQSVLTFCVEDPTTTPQQILIEYLDADLEVVCSDTLETACAVEPDCLYALSDTLTCGPENTLIYTGTFCNPADALFAVEYLQFLALSPAAMGSLPQGIMLDSPLLPGDCTTVTLTLNATEPGSEFCYSVVAHSANPDENPGAVCCEIEEKRCLKVPDCDPCDDLGVVGAKPLSPNDSPDDCCYAITLFNEVTEPALTSLELCVIEGMADLTAYTSLGGGWVAETSADGQSVSLTTEDGPLPVGTFELPPLCLSDVDQPYTQVAIKWLAKDSIVCRDTLELFCEPDCGYLVTKEIGCQDGQYVWAGELFNTSGYEISEAYLAFDAASGLTAYNQTLPFSPAIPDGSSQSLNFSIGSPAGPGDTICFTITLHELDHDEFHLNCCQFETCIVLPDCEIEQCVCDEKFFATINEGFTAPLGSNNASVTLNPAVNFGSCDEINWLVRTVPGDFDLVGTGYDYTYSFPANDSYEICMEVVRTLPNGETCSDQICRTFEIGGKLVEIYPNPSFGDISISFESEGRQPLTPPQDLTLQLFNNQGQSVARWRRADLAETATSGIYSIDLAGLPPGVYLLRGQSEHQQWTRRILLLR